ncbi:DUF4265 domain-containing protein [Actinomadura sp. WMMB 499]|uniref:DUF4265 domain-containing protein n=1 Tax=Actinomadura sp. WMMB 499 TaxID=1219491 RepID=UPI00159DCC26|nr:DUF4265 domain-containing protein [Actinomadura sp. WMMB 499]
MQFIVHEHPVGRAAQNYLAHVDLERFGLAGQREQLWLRPCQGGDYVVACLPFRVYGLALNDRVRLSEDGATVVELLERSGHRVLRVLFTPRSDQDAFMARITGEVEIAGLAFEWSGKRHLAVDVPQDASPVRLFGVLQEEIDAQQAYWEWADVEAF